MKKWLCIPLGLLILLAIYGVNQIPSTSAAQQTYQLYYLSDSHSSGSALATEPYSCDGTDEPTSELLRALLRAPTSPDLTSPFPKGTALLSEEQKDGVLTLNFSKEYGDLTGVQLTLANGAVVLTMTQLQQVSGVVILSAGESVLPRQTQQLLTAKDFDLSGMSADPISFKATLFFPSEDGSTVLQESRTLQASTTTQTGTIQAVLNALCAGSDRTGAAAYLPATTDGVSVELEKKVCRLTLPDQWAQALLDENGNANLAAWALSASLTELEEVDQVRFYHHGTSISGLSEEKIKAVYPAAS